MPDVHGEKSQPSPRDNCTPHIGKHIGKTKGRIAVEPEYRHQVSFLDTTLSLLRQATEYIPQLTP
jgi:hypothetical protein